MGGGSKSSSSNQSTTNTNTQNLSLDDVDGVTVAGSESVTVNMTDGGAFDLIENMASGFFDGLSDSQAKAIDTVANTTIKSLDRVNESNESETSEFLNKAVVIAGIGAAAYVAAKKM